VIALVAPEPAPWVELFLRQPAELLGDAGAGGVALFAPWRRAAWRAADRALGLVVRGGVGGMMARRFAVRAAVDRVAAAWLPAGATAVVAPSCGALRTFAAATARGIAAFLVEDLPLLRQLHADLDEAARRYPGCPLLARYRAPAHRIVRQEREQALARRVFARGLYAAEQLAARGHAVRPVAMGPPPAPAPPRRPRPPWTRGRGLRVLLAGPPCGRSGVNEALAAVAALDGASLLVRPSDALEPRDLLRHPAVRLASPPELAELRGVDVVVAPAPCESYPPEVMRAAALGVPVVATRRAAGPVDLGRAGAEVRPFDVPALCAAVARLSVLGARG
jgi:hypothetical protein